MKLTVLLVIVTALVGCGPSKPPETRPQGETERPKTEALEAGAKLLQRSEPLEGMDVYLVGFHPMKKDPNHQMEAHHFCRQVNEDFAQCVLFDGNGKEANLNGIEYIISEKVFETLPSGERAFWHPHNFEILSGQLQAPGLPAVAEEELMRKKMNSYGKTWHVWMTNQGQQLPFGEAMLAWSFNREGEIDPAVQSGFEKRHGPIADKRRERQDLTPMARPQEGVDALNGRFGRPARSIPGVTQKAASAQQ